MTDATNPGDIQVWGQRRQNSGLFPTAGGAAAPLPLNTPVRERRDPESPYFDPCQIPVSRAAWNADAEAIVAGNSIMSQASSIGSNLSQQEFGAVLYHYNGGIHMLPQQPGGLAVNGVIPSINLNWGTTVNAQNYRGDIHSHPSGDPRLSASERQVFVDYVNWLISNATPGMAGIYRTIAAYVMVLDSSSPTGFRMYANTVDTPLDTVGREVNPLAEPACP